MTCPTTKPWPGHVVTPGGTHYVVNHRCVKRPDHPSVVHRCRCGESWVGTREGGNG